MPAAASWALAGALAGWLGSLLAPGRAALAAVAAYAACYGLAETTGRSGLPPPGRSWQVPSRWVDQVPEWRRLLVWGALLGPGFATRNPYAGFGLLPLTAAATGSPRLGAGLAALLGFLHGAARAAALLRDSRRAATADYLLAVLRSMRWRTLDGIALLVVAGTATMAIAARR